MEARRLHSACCDLPTIRLLSISRGDYGTVTADVEFTRDDKRYGQTVHAKGERATCRICYSNHGEPYADLGSVYYFCADDDDRIRSFVRGSKSRETYVSASAVGKTQPYSYGDIIVLGSDKQDGMKKITRAFALRDFCKAVSDGMAHTYNNLGFDVGETVLDVRYTDDAVARTSVDISVPSDDDDDVKATLTVQAACDLSDTKQEYKVSYSCNGSTMNAEQFRKWISELTEE